MVSETGHIVEIFFTLGRWNDVLGMWYFPFDLPHGSVVYADKVYCDYNIEDAPHAAGITFRPFGRRT